MAQRCVDGDAGPICQYPGCWLVATHRGPLPSGFLHILPWEPLAIMREGKVIAVGKFSPEVMETILKTGDKLLNENGQSITCVL